MEKRTAFTLAIPLCVLFNVLFLRFSPIIIITSSENSHPIILCRHGNTDCTNEPTYQTTHINWNGSEFIDVQTGRPTAKKNALYCRLKKVSFSTMTRTLPPPSNGSVLNPYFPSESLENLVRYNSCAVVSSSHGLKLHNYGHDIDSHDAVLRFNCAPTQGFSAHVGSRTDIRLINTQIPEKTCTDEFWDERIKMFNNETVVIRNFDSIRVVRGKIDTRKDKYKSFFNYIRYRKMYPNSTTHFIQRSNFGLDLRNELKRFCETTKGCKPSKMSPSSGSLGVIMMLHLCDWVYTYEIVPSSVDKTRLAYYYSGNITKNHNAFHSIATERQYFRTLTVTPPDEVERTGVAVFRGLSQYNCT
ncbi:beta-galactoside alpha-2,6-sialyltransferase 1-like isoform X2 [Branchiostoma floridae]|nr:beta-galactoside alpha-2,6-sialyltransferase 1-like isoform X2 [Branchiostoma floridae]XP_035695399.1 beta-galactoside alpha-2,6-sialyltransferase 1-like isoform X2 [Branchiostoma floridae]XP_035695400.1 beta-galactoside alpha-2,6-sialyltransferase 1-like isoform X2 [Branchiostoma floridae]